MSFAIKLKRARKRAKLSQSQTARILGCAPPRISEWEREVRTPKLLTQEAIMARIKKGKGKAKRNGK